MEGTGPFSIAIRDAASHETVVETAATAVRLPLDGLAPGPASVRLRCADGSAVIDIELVPATAVPVIPGEPDAPEVARGIWMLLRANAAWKLEAMSRLVALARQSDPFAGAIIGGMP